MPLKLKGAPLSDSDDDDDNIEDEQVKKRLRLVKEISDSGKLDNKFSGGIVVSSEYDAGPHSASASLSAAEKKGLKEVEELERELDLKNTFSKETNRRDEDAEMNKYIDEQIRLRREAMKKEGANKTDGKTTTKDEDSDLSELFSLPGTATEKVEDILLYNMSKTFASATDEKSEAMLSSQMLNGIPEVDLGSNERIRTIEATEEAKLRLASSGPSRHSERKPSTVPINFSSNFQRRSARDNRDGGHNKNPSHRSSSNYSKTIIEAVVAVGEDPKEVEYRLPSSMGERPPPKGKASDDYYLQKFKKNNRR